MKAHTPTDNTARMAGQSDRLVHRGYISATQTALGQIGVPARLVRSGGDAVRHADLVVNADRASEQVLLRWDEINGWSLHDRGNGSPAIFFGVTAIPSPDELATWVLLSLRHLDVTALRTGQPFAPVDLLEQLRKYQQHTA